MASFKFRSLSAACIMLLTLGMSSLAAAAPAEEAAEPAESAQTEGDNIPTDVWDRIRRGYAIPNLNSDKVDYWIRFYTKNPAYMKRMTERASKYLYNIAEEVESRGMPMELALLPFVESAFEPEALSHAKAAGLWQFMPATGNEYSLAQNLWRDDRQDILESTRAALDYFEYLHGLFNDWQLSLAAYNWGEGSVQRAIARAKARKQKTDYAHLRMPKETANYVPKLEAIKKIVADPAKYGVELPDVGNEPFFVQVTKPRDIDVKTAAELAGMPLDEFRRLNPSYKLPVLVAAHNNVMLLPADKVDYFIDNLASWMDSGQPLSRWTTYKMKEGENLSKVAAKFGMTEDEVRKVNGIPKGRKVLAHSTLLVRSDNAGREDISAEEADARLRLSPATTWRRVVYRVRSGDNLTNIARRWHITVKSIVTSNRLRNDRLKIGQRLILTVPNVERQSIRTVQTKKSSHVIHTVRSGDSLSTIAARYGVTISELKKTNRLSRNLIRPGQRLRIPAAGEVERAEETMVYTVKAGDTLSTIAKRHGVSLIKLKRTNRLSGDALRIGQKLEIPERDAVRTTNKSAPQTRLYVVKSGDTLSQIGERFGVSLAKLRSANGLRGNNIRVGQKLVIPATARTAAANARASSSEYVVKKGDTLVGISRKTGVLVKKLRELNNISGSTIRVNQVLKLR